MNTETARLIEALEKLIRLHGDWSTGSASIRKAFVEQNNAAIREAREAIANAKANS